jgi:general secretion pathway protein G
MKCKTHTIARRQGGFTLVELLLVMTILGILAALVVPRFGGRTEDAKKAAAHTQISNFSTALDTFEVDNGYYPKGRNGLNDLLVQPRDAQNWHGPYLKIDAIPLDPWQHAYLYECPGKHNPTSYDLYSAGTDGQTGNADDICNWTVK